MRICRSGGEARFAGAWLLASVTLGAGCANVPMPGFLSNNAAQAPAAVGPTVAPAAAAVAPAAAAVAPALAPLPPYEGIKKRLAVIRLENKVKTPIPDASWQLGEGLTEMLTTELFRTGRFVMVERAALADIVKEQELGQTGLIQKETATKVGEMLGAQLLVAGAITEFEPNAGGGGGGLGIGAFKLQMRGNIAHVAVDIRLVDAATGQILKSFNAEAKAQDTEFSIVAVRRQTTLGSDAFNKTPLGQATREAIAKAIGFIVGEMEVVPWTGRVVQTNGNQVFVNAGSNMNLRSGTRLAVFSKGDELRDPATGLVLGSRDTRVGTITLMQIEEKFSVGTYSGTAPVRRGDLLKPHDAP